MLTLGYMRGVATAGGSRPRIIVPPHRTMRPPRRHRGPLPPP